MQARLAVLRGTVAPDRIVSAECLEALGRDGGVRKSKQHSALRCWRFLGSHMQLLAVKSCQQLLSKLWIQKP
jgi:hypothetical protein